MRREWMIRVALNIVQVMPVPWRVTAARRALALVRPEYLNPRTKRWHSMGRVDVEDYDHRTGELTVWINPPEDDDEEA